jgi:hypothetical protein
MVNPISDNGNNPFMVIGGRNEYILNVRGISFLGWAGRLIKSLKEITSFLFVVNNFTTP